MGQTQVVEGTTEEIAALLQAGAFACQKLRVIVESEEEEFSDTLPDPPNSIRDEAHLEQLLLEGLNSGHAVPMAETEWEDIHREVHAHAARRGSIACDGSDNDVCTACIVGVGTEDKRGATL